MSNIKIANNFNEHWNVGTFAYAIILTHTWAHAHTHMDTCTHTHRGTNFHVLYYVYFTSQIKVPSLLLVTSISIINIPLYSLTQCYPVCTYVLCLHT